MSHEFALRVQGIIEPLGHSLCVSMPAEGLVVVNSVIRAYPILVEGEILYANLIITRRV